MAIRSAACALAVAMLLATSRVDAHHHIGCDYDTAATRTLAGQVLEIGWKFPHVHIRLNAPDGAPGGITWDLETVTKQA